MRVLFITGREITYARNEVLVRALRRFATVDVVSAHRQPRSLAGNSLWIAVRALPYVLGRRYDLVFVGFYGYLILLLLRPFLRAPILFDAFVSNYDTLAFDRQTVSAVSLRGRLAYGLDWFVCRLANVVLLDTAAHVDYFAQTFGLQRDRLDWLPVGCSDSLFAPRQPAATSGHPTRVLNYCTYLPIHGVEIILQAAARVQGEPIEFHLIGSGPLYPAMRALARWLNLSNVTFWPPCTPSQLADAIAAADLCLGGHFGASDKAQRVVPGKIYQMLAVGRAVIAADAPGNRELLVHGANAYLTPPADPDALAVAILTLHRDPALRSLLATGGHVCYRDHASEVVITTKLQSIVDRLLTRAPTR